MLYLVSTPIGNLADISLRALEVLKGVDCIAAEDTRHTRKLLRHYELQGSLISYHEHNERSRLKELVNRLQQGHKIALVTDAGTPCISDPGFCLVRAAQDAKIPITAVPGANAAIMAIALSGCAVDRFHYLGFLPVKKGKRLNLLRQVEPLQCTIVAYESPYRITKSLVSIGEVWGEQTEVCLCRELTKKHEEICTHSVRDWLQNERSFKGECVLVWPKKAWRKMDV